MLERIQIDGFRALTQVDVPLKPLTVLVGQNDSGKSSFIDAIRFLVSGSDIALFDRKDAKTTSGFTVTAYGAGGTQLSRSDGFVGPPANRSPFIRPTEFFRLPSHGVAMESPGFPHLMSQGESGEYTASILDTLLRTDRKRFDQIEEKLCEHLPGLKGIAIETPESSTRRIDLVLQGGLKMPASRASTGARLMIFFITLAYHPTPPGLILLEEPENGVHPKRLEQIVALLREITEGKHGNHAAQIIMTTHSPYLLDFIDPTKDQVITFRREPNGDRVAEAVDNDRLKDFLDNEFKLGEIWFNQGEDGLIKRVG